jgi:hypothetical protein
MFVGVFISVHANPTGEGGSGLSVSAEVSRQNWQDLSLPVCQSSLPTSRIVSKFIEPSQD